MNPLRFLIWAWDYSTDTGGGVALHRLAHNLALRGHDARLTCHRTCHDWRGLPTEQRLAASNQIVVYPEIVEGNPLGGRRVVRWILNTPGFYGKGNGDGVYGGQDLIMQWSADFKVDPKYKVGGLLTAFRDYSEFRDRGYSDLRQGVCYAVRKGRGKVLDQHPADALCIDDYAARGGDDYLINVFNERERFICYDDVSMLPTLAALCGCPTLGQPAPEVLRAQLTDLIAATGPQTVAFVELCRGWWNG